MYPAKKGGHLQINLGAKKRTYVHRLVAEAFLGRVYGKDIVNHKNGNPSDNRVENLEWVTPGENISHGFRENGRIAHNSVAVEARDSAGRTLARFESMAAAGRALGVTRTAIRIAVEEHSTCCGLRWFRA